LLYVPSLPAVDSRLDRRYGQLVVAHASDAHELAAGLRLPPGLTRSFSAVQAAWRFFRNERILLPQLAEPLIQCARADIRDACREVALVAMDWCDLHFGGHKSKQDRVELANSKDLGYDMLTALAIGDRDGAPIAPLAVEVRAADGAHSTRADRPIQPLSQLDNLQPIMDHVAGLELGMPSIFVIDREADSVGHYRAWDQAGHRFLVRANDARLVRHDNTERTLGTVADGLKTAMRYTREVEYKGRHARQYVAETSVVLHRPARTHRVDPKSGKKKHKDVAGPPITLRLVVSEVRDGQQVLARWLLLSNVAEADAATVALWYYWRWRIESYHKLLKKAGQQVQSWQQETAAALTRRLLVAAMSVVLVWRLARTEGKEAEAMRDLLVRLSGRQMKRGKGRAGFTEPALLAGLGVLISMLDLLSEHSIEEIRNLAASTLPWITQLPRPAPNPNTEGGRSKMNS
jgi:hypothetical protein